MYTNLINFRAPLIFDPNSSQRRKATEATHVTQNFCSGQRKERHMAFIIKQSLHTCYWFLLEGLNQTKVISSTLSIINLPWDWLGNFTNKEISLFGALRRCGLKILLSKRQLNLVMHEWAKSVRALEFSWSSFLECLLWHESWHYQSLKMFIWWEPLRVYLSFSWKVFLGVSRFDVSIEFSLRRIFVHESISSRKYKWMISNCSEGMQSLKVWKF